MEKEQKELQVPNDLIRVELFGNIYKEKIANNYILEKIERQKIEKSDNTHRLLLMGQTSDSLYVYALVEAKIVIECLFPEVLDDLGLKSFDELNIIQTKEMVDVYTKEIRPVLNKIYDFLNGIQREITEESAKNQDEEQRADTEVE